jgi:hypothetical protein
MYDIRQFKPTLYILVILGITGFALAAQTPGLWLIAMLLVLGNAWLIKTELFTPLPRVLANGASMLALLFAFSEIHTGAASPILVIGQFLVMMQIIKLWEQRANRDYAQLLVLSLLLMVAAAISTASLVFGLMLIAYLFLSLYCCLLFHLKVETDEAKKALALPERVSPSTLRQDQRYLPRSMRRLTALVSSFAVICAVVVFLFFPRGTGAGMFGQIAWRPKDTLTGFNDSVSYQEVAKITQNTEQVATVKVWDNAKLLPFSGPLYLRGITHDIYNGAGGPDRAAYTWSRSPGPPNDVRTPDDSDQSELGVPGSAGPQRYRQEIQLQPTGTPVIFAIRGVNSVKVDNSGGMRRFSMRYSPSDQTVQASEPLVQPIRYTVMSSGFLGSDRPPINHEQSQIDPLITQYAQQAEVSGPGLAERRAAIATTRPIDQLSAPTELDEDIARNIESHLRGKFQYTLDLTDAPQKGKDPIVAFLYDWKRGHCEYFAGAMTLLCQSLGLQARMVVGFKCDEYNDFGNYYNVKQSHAHAWVEVLTSSGWQTFDPTSGRESGPAAASAWLKTKHFFEFLEYSWANAVIAYNAENRENLVQNLDNRLTNTAIASSVAMGGVKGALNDLGSWLASHVLGPMLVGLGLAMAGCVGWFLWERWRLRKRASRIGIETLPASAQARLVRQLGFYDELLRLLERHDIVRPRHLTPLEFSNSLSFLPAEAYDTISRLTQVFYRIRYGLAELDGGQQRRLSNVIGQLAGIMAPTARPLASQTSPR